MIGRPEFASLAEIYDFIEKEAERRASRIAGNKSRKPG
jgi:hypothetical protein